MFEQFSTILSTLGHAGVHTGRFSLTREQDAIYAVNYGNALCLGS